MTHADVSKCSTRLRRAVLVLARRLRPILGRDGLGAAKLSVVGMLHRQGAMTPTALAAREGVRLASLTRPLAELEAEGWIARRADPADGRSSLLSITALGRRRLAASAGAADEALADALAAAFHADELPELLAASALLERVADAMQEVGVSGGPIAQRATRRA